MNIPFIRFAGVGVLNTLNYFLFFTFCNVFLYYVASHVIAFLMSALISFFLTTLYTYETKVDLVAFLKFPITFLPNLIFSTFGTYVLVQYNILSEDFASLIMMLFAIPITFLVGKVLYTKRSDDE